MKITSTREPLPPPPPCVYTLVVSEREFNMILAAMGMAKFDIMDDRGFRRNEISEFCSTMRGSQRH